MTQTDLKGLKVALVYPPYGPVKNEPGIKAVKENYGIFPSLSLLYVAGILYFAVAPAVSAETWRVAALNGAIIGFLAYGTYEATNLATLRGWSYEMLIVDVAWGMSLTAMTAVVGFMVYGWMAG